VQYVVGRRLAGQSFASIGTVTNNTAGNFKADIAVRTSTHYDYQVTAVDANGTILAISAIQGIDTPAQYPSVQGLSATAAPLQTVNVTMAGQVTSVQGQVMTYMWDNFSFIGNQFATLDHITTDPATGQPTSVRSWNTLNPVQPGAQFGVAAGTSARFCVAAIPDPDDATNLASPTCLTTTLAPAPRTSTTNTRVTNALNDAPAPTVTLTPTAGGIKVAYTLVPGAVNHTMCRESPAGSACMPIGAPGVTVLNNVATVWDLALSPATYAYRVTATQADGHYGEERDHDGRARAVARASERTRVQREYDSLSGHARVGPGAVRRLPGNEVDHDVSGAGRGVVVSTDGEWHSGHHPALVRTGDV
jgi:hypothetical protein